MTTSTRTPSRTRRESLESPVRLTAPAGFGGRLPGPPGSPPYTCCGTARCSALFGGVRAPSTLGSHLRSLYLGQRRASWRRRAGSSWLSWPGRRRCCPARTRWRSSTSTRCRNGSTGTHKQGARFGHTKIQGKSLLVRGLNALAAVISTPLSAPVIAATRLRGGNAASARGAASLAAAGHRHRAGLRLHRDDHRPDGLGVLQRRGDRRDPPRRAPGSRSPSR